MTGCVDLWTGLWSCYKAHRPPLVYQSKTFLGLGQVQMARPKVLATGAAAQTSKHVILCSLFCSHYYATIINQPPNGRPEQYRLQHSTAASNRLFGRE